MIFIQFSLCLFINETIVFLQNYVQDLLKKCQQCIEIIRTAKDRQAAEAYKNATILLEELDIEKYKEESRKLAAQRKREKRKKKKIEKREERKKTGDKGGDDDKVFHSNFRLAYRLDKIPVIYCFFKMFAG